MRNKINVLYPSVFSSILVPFPIIIVRLTVAKFTRPLSVIKHNRNRHSPEYIRVLCSAIMAAVYRQEKASHRLTNTILRVNKYSNIESIFFLSFKSLRGFISIFFFISYFFFLHKNSPAVCNRSLSITNEALNKKCRRVE